MCLANHKDIYFLRCEISETFFSFMRELFETCVSLILERRKYIQDWLKTSNRKLMSCTPSTYHLPYSIRKFSKSILPIFTRAHSHSQNLSWTETSCLCGVFGSIHLTPLTECLVGRWKCFVSIFLCLVKGTNNSFKHDNIFFLWRKSYHIFALIPYLPLYLLLSSLPKFRFPRNFSCEEPNKGWLIHN